MLNLRNLALFSLVIGAFSCTDDAKTKTVDTPKKNDIPKVEMSFTRLDEEATGIGFKNSIKENDELNFFNFEYVYNGGGVAVGDVNNDGLKDLYFTGNQTADKLYLNKGDLKFEDITSSAIGDVATDGWHTGVTMADVNQDGWIDIYISRSGNTSNKEMLGNLLLINNQDNTFTEKGEEYGVNVQRMTTQSSFFDFDNDGDLDLYVMNHPLQDDPYKPKKSVEEVKAMIKAGSPDADVLLENVDGKFVDISQKAGIGNHSYGLGLTVSDVNNDGYVDIFVTNDYMAPDNLWMNNGDGTFTDEILDQFKHISNFAMGNDIADFNNDGLLDILAVDMASEDHVRSKKNMGGMDAEKFWGVVLVGFHYQYMFNTLQLNNGNGTFSEIAQHAGISKTDWSWAPLFIDFDNDGYKDLFISNGYRRDSRDNDYLNSTHFNKDMSFEKKLDLMPATKIQNYIYQNNGDYHFDKRLKEWNVDFPVNSNGAAYADFDNDGDVDLVLNNMDETACILRNDLNSDNNYVRVKLKGPNNSNGLGSKVKITTKDGIQYQELQVTRGYISSVEDILHFGIGQNELIGEIRIDWKDGKSTVLKDVKPNQTIVADYASGKILPQENAESQKWFTDVSDKMPQVASKQFVVNDFAQEVLLPNKMSQLGPFVSSGDVNGDGLDDFFISGSRGFEGRLYVQQTNGSFKIKQGPWKHKIQHEEMDSEFIDVDNDGDLDLYVVSGSNEYEINSNKLFDQLYINDGEGNFKNETATRLPQMITSGQSIAFGDIDNDGDMDLFLGGRQTPGYYPFAPRSYLLLNEGGYFKDITDNSEDILGPGLVTDAIFDDFDGDGDQDLICVGEWMPISFFSNNNGIFTNVTANMGMDKDVGWWYSISKGDFNGDGKNDYIAGNLGSNNKFHPSHQNPLEIYCTDFDNSNSYDIVLAKYQDNVCYPVRGKQCSTEQMPFISQKFPTYSEFAEADLKTIYGQEKLDKALHYSATNFKSSIVLSNGNSFDLKPLPSLAQFSPLNASTVIDINNDGHLDVVGVGNNYAAEVETVRYDAGTGLVLMGDGTGNFTPKRGIETGFHSDNDDKDITVITIKDKKYFLVAGNNTDLRWISLN